MTISQRIDASPTHPHLAALAAPARTCDRHGCDAPATDRRRGLDWCRAHFMWVLTWEQSA